MYKKYSNEECDKLRKFYPNNTKENLLLEFPDRTWNALRLQSKKLNIKRDIDDRINENTHVENLVNDTLESYYWLGFLLADGSFIKDKAIRCEISTKDKEHLEKLAKYINFKIRLNNKRNSVSLAIYNYKIIPQIIELLGLDVLKQKTYHCPDINKINLLNKNKLLSLFVGFIDGDGCIRKAKNTIYLIISNHKSWFPFYELMINFLQNYSDKVLPKYSINKYIRWCCGQREFLLRLKDEILKLKLPLMARKWNRIL